MASGMDSDRLSVQTMYTQKRVIADGRRRWCAITWLALIVLLGGAAPRIMSAEPASTPIAVVDFNYLDTSGEAHDQDAAHLTRLSTFMLAVREDLERSGRFHVVPMTCDPAPCSLTTTEAAHLIEAAQASGARFLLFGGIHKESTLVQWARAQVMDLGTGLVVFDRLLSFRGDDEAAWRHAESFLLKQVVAYPFTL